MTIALGFAVDDGVVVATDTQETVQGYWKREQKKTIAFQLKHGSGVIAGAGRAGYADSLAQELFSIFETKKKPWDRRSLRLACERVLSRFHKEHVSPYSDVPEVQMVIAWTPADVRTRPSLFVNDRASLIDAEFSHGCVAAGIGAAHVMPLIKSLLDFQQIPWSLIDAAVLAAYCVFQAKRSVDGCGNLTDLHFVSRLGATGFHEGMIQRLEAIFTSFDTRVAPEFVGSLLNRQWRPLNQSWKLLDACKLSLGGLLDSLAKVDPANSEAKTITHLPAKR